MGDNKSNKKTVLDVDLGLKTLKEALDVDDAEEVNEHKLVYEVMGGGVEGHEARDHLDRKDRDHVKEQATVEDVAAPNGRQVVHQVAVLVIVAHVQVDHDLRSPHPVHCRTSLDKLPIKINCSSHIKRWKYRGCSQSA